MDQIPITQPITPIGDQRPGTGRFARRLAQRRAGQRHEDDEDADLEFHDLPPRRLPTDPAQPLLEALDRLRVTNEIRPAEVEYAKAVQALKAYQEPTTSIHRIRGEPPEATPQPSAETPET